MHPRPIPAESGSLVITRPSEDPGVLLHTCTLWAGGRATTAVFDLPACLHTPTHGELFAHLEKHTDDWTPVRPRPSTHG